MSLDVYLTGTATKEQCQCDHCGNTYERDVPERLYEANITHNLNIMAEKAGIYECMWRPDEHGFTKAAQLVEPLRAGLSKLKDDPEYYQTFDSKNGWGLYKHFVSFVEKYLRACEEYPEADVSVSW